MTTAHEPRRGPGVHLSTEDLSALAEGAEPTAEGASEHLLGCAACRGEVDAIAELLAAFETFDEPEIPQEVAIRIDAALAREAAARTASSSPAASASASADGVSGARRRRRLSRGFAWGLASLAVVAGGVTLAVNLISTNAPMSGSAASSGAAIKPYASVEAGPQRAEGQLSSPGLIAPTSALAIWVKQALAGTRPDAQINSPCLADPAFGGEQPLRVVNGTYEGVSAALVVYANGTDPKTVRAVVYAQPCAASSYRVLAQGIVAK